MKNTLVFVVLFYAALIENTDAQFLQQGSKLVGSGAVGVAYQGWSVSLSSDGNTAIVGGYSDNSSVGAAWVFTRSSGLWTQQGSKLVGTGAVGTAGQGYSVSLSSDGNTAIVGGLYDNGSAGAAWVFTRSGGAWTQQGSKLVGTGAVGAANQGISVSLSSDGNTAIVGGLNDDSRAGAAWVFTRSGGVWTQQGSKLVGSGAVGSARQGYSVSLSSDGNTALVSGANDSSGAGAAWVFTRSGGAWIQQGSKLVGSGAVGTANQGISVSLSSDGNTALVGGYGDNSLAGAAWVFTRSGGVWTQQGSKLVGSGAVGVAYQGWSVSLSSDGNTAIVGGYRDNFFNSGCGASWVFRRSIGVWTQQGSKLVGVGAVGLAYQGYTVSLSSDGNTAIVGGYGDNSETGAAWIFTVPVGQVSLVYPADQATVVSTVIPFVWDKPTGNPTGYAFNMATDSLFTFQTIDSTLTDTTKVVTGLSGAGTYWWRVKAKNEYGWGSFSPKRAFTLTLTGVEQQSPLPTKFFLAQNYPNPFNPTTTISFSLPSKSFVTLKVFDLIGREVATLVNEKEPAGSYQVHWNAANMPSGVYFYRLQAGSFTQTKKFILLK